MMEDFVLDFCREGHKWIMQSFKSIESCSTSVQLFKVLHGKTYLNNKVIIIWFNHNIQQIAIKLTYNNVVIQNKLQGRIPESTL